MSVIQSIKELYPPYKNWLIQTDTFGDKVAATILKNNDVNALKRLISSTSNNWSDRYFYSLAMSRRFNINSLKNWMEAEPASSDACLVYGARLLKWSWDARGYGRGTTISEDQWREFYQRLEMTREALETCAHLNPDDPVPWAYLIMVAVYAQYGEEAERAYFEQCIERDPESWAGHIHRLTGLTEKYGGSHSQMFDFARATASNARSGSLLPALLLKAHTEYWKYLDLFEGDTAAAERHRNDKDARAESLEAYQKTLGSHQYDERMAVFARINAAGWFFLAEDAAILRDELLALEGSIYDIHWRWVGTEHLFQHAERLAGIK